MRSEQNNNYNGNSINKIDNIKDYIANDVNRVITMTMTHCSASEALRHYFSFYLCSINVIIRSNIHTTFLDPIIDCFGEQFLRKQSNFLT